MPMTQGKSLLILLFRGALGGITGGFVFATVEVGPLRPNGWDNWLGYFLILFIIYGLPFGLFMGLLISIGIWFVPDKAGKASGLVARAVFGTLFGAIACAVVLFGNSSAQEGYIKTSWIVALFGIFLLGAAFGGIPAIIIGKQSQK